MSHESSIFSDFIIGCMRLGKWGAQFNSKEYENFIDNCLGLEFHDFDHADIYGDYTTEAQFGEVLKRRNDLKQKVRITTKCGIKLKSVNKPNHKLKSYDSSPEHIIKSVDSSLKNLGIEQINVLLLHRPDSLMDARKVAETFTSLKNQGKVLHFGVSNFSTAQFDLLNAFYPLVTNQVEFSPWRLNALEDGILEQCQKLNICPTVWSPFGGGRLFNEDDETNEFNGLVKIKEMAVRHNCSPSQLVLTWLKKHPSGIIPVLGSTNISRIQEAKLSLEVSISNEAWYELLEAFKGQEVK